jgi:hypothetical protein
MDKISEQRFENLERKVKIICGFIKRNRNAIVPTIEISNLANELDELDFNWESEELPNK